MNFLTILEIIRATEGKLTGTPSAVNGVVSQIITDSRTFFGKDALFFALKGPRNNGHDYLGDLHAKGIRAYVISENVKTYPDSVYIEVDDTTLALQKLAAFYRKKFSCPVIGITGSNGKTIVKEWLYSLLSGTMKIVRSPKSYNSQTGVPLSVLLMTESDDLAIFEAGISKPGEMIRLSNIISPTLGIFTNIGDAHQENFTSLEEKIREKLMLFSSSEKLVYCNDFPGLARETENFCTQNHIETITWSLQDQPSTICFSADIQDDKTLLKAKLGENKTEFIIPFTDQSSIENACHCFAAAYTLMSDINPILHLFGELEPVAMRLEIRQGINRCLLINDYYNSDLHSLGIALSVLHQQAARDHLSKQVILSDIRQTGIPSDELYKKVNELLETWEIDHLTGIGPEISGHASLFSLKKDFYPSTEAFEASFYREKIKPSAILIKGARIFAFEKISALLQEKAHQTVFEINLNALVSNLNIYRGLLYPSTKIMVMVKAFSYGTGDVEVAKVLEYAQVSYLAVAVADEGVQLRNAGIKTPIIVMNPEQHSFRNILEYKLEPNLYSAEILDSFTREVASQGLSAYPVHIKLETGMNRLGFGSEEEISKAIQKIAEDNLLKIVSVFSHLAAADDPVYDDFTREQVQLFEKRSSLILNFFPYRIMKHLLNSAGIERFREYQYDMVRLGIGLYGISATGLPLQQIGTLKSIVSQVKHVDQSQTVGYSRKGHLARNSRIAIVPLGYADGLDRKLGNNKGAAYIKGHVVPVIGNICMDMLMLDVTGLDVNPGDEAEFFGPHISISSVAENAGTIPYEILTGISQRVKRIYLQE